MRRAKLKKPPDDQYWRFPIIDPPSFTMRWNISKNIKKKYLFLLQVSHLCQKFINWWFIKIDTWRRKPHGVVRKTFIRHRASVGRSVALVWLSFRLPSRNGTKLYRAKYQEIRPGKLIAVVFKSSYGPAFSQSAYCRIRCSGLLSIKTKNGEKKGIKILFFKKKRKTETLTPHNFLNLTKLWFLSVCILT